MWQPPSEKIDENSFMFAVAEILRFLRDMALDISTAQSKSLLQTHQKEKNSSASPPTMAAALLRSTPSSHLVPPCAVLCMLDLLPAISLDSSQLPGDQDDDDDQCWALAQDELSEDEGQTFPKQDSEIGAGGKSEITGGEIQNNGGSSSEALVDKIEMLMVWFSLDCQMVMVMVVIMVV